MTQHEVETHRAQRQYDDEISLVDLARVLIRRKRWFFGTFLVCVLGALALALIKEREYTFSTNILLGQYGVTQYANGASGQAIRTGTKVEYVETATEAKNALESRIVPSVEREFIERQEVESVPATTSVDAEDGNNFVVLSSKASSDLQPVVSELHGSMVKALVDEHKDKLSLLEKESAIRLRNLRASLATEQRQFEDLQKLLAESTEVIDQAVSESEVTANSQSGDSGLEATLNSSNKTLTFLLSQLQLGAQLSERESRINELRGEIEAEELEQAWFKPTRAVNVATASTAPSSTGKILIVLLGAVLGSMLGIFTAFIAEFVARVRRAGA